MEHKIINTGDYLLIVDDSDIKEGDYCLMFDDYGNIFLGNTPQKYLGESAGHFLNKGLKKVISHLPLNNSPILEGVILLPPLEDEVEKKLNENCNPKIATIMIKGYNKAKEKYKYTEEEMKRIYEKGYSAGRNELNSRESDKIKYDYIQSLQQPKIPVGFKREFLENKLWGQKGTGVYITTTTSQGFTQWVGEYIYD